LLGGIAVRRITAFLPVGTDADLDAAIGITSWLQQLKDVLPDLAVWGGTFSLLSPNVFDGFYYSAEREQWVEEAVALLIVDIPYEESTLQDFITLLVTEFANRYQGAGSTQEEIGLSMSNLEYTSY